MKTHNPNDLQYNILSFASGSETIKHYKGSEDQPIKDMYPPDIMLIDYHLDDDMVGVDVVNE